MHWSVASTRLMQCIGWLSTGRRSRQRSRINTSNDDPPQPAALCHSPAEQRARYAGLVACMERISNVSSIVMISPHSQPDLGG